jgi:hypothetical protein
MHVSDELNPKGLTNRIPLAVYLHLPYKQLGIRPPYFKQESCISRRCAARTQHEPPANRDRHASWSALIVPASTLHSAAGSRQPDPLPYR